MSSSTGRENIAAVTEIEIKEANWDVPSNLENEMGEEICEVLVSIFRSSVNNGIVTGDCSRCCLLNI